MNLLRIVFTALAMLVIILPSITTNNLPIDSEPFQDVTGPTIEGIFIAVPEESQIRNTSRVVIAANVTDPSGVERVILSYYSDDSGPSHIGWENVSMTVDYENTYIGEIPSMVELAYPNNTPHDMEVQYKILAQDREGNWAITPPMAYIAHEITETSTETTEITTSTTTSPSSPLLSLAWFINAAVMLVVLLICIQCCRTKYCKTGGGVRYRGPVRRYPRTVPPWKRIPPAAVLKTTERTVKVFKGGEVVGGRFEYKVKVQNDTPYVIHRVTVTIVTYPQICLELVGETVIQIPMIEPGGFRSPEFVFTPTEDCVQGEVIASVSYIDYQGDLQVVKVEPYVIRSVCDLLNPYEVSLQEFESLISDMQNTSEAKTLNWNPKVLFSKAESLLPSKNFYILESSSGTTAGEFRGVIIGIAEGKYTKKIVVVQLTITGAVDGKESEIKFEGIGDDLAMLPTTIHEIAEEIDSWTCINCGAALTAEDVETLKRRKSVECRYCQHIMTIDLYI